MDTRVELAYAAGFIDGDGCVYLALNHRRREVPYLLVQLIASGVDERPLVRLQRLLGGKIHLESFRRGRNNRPVYRWDVAGQTAVDALKALSPFLSLKREQADLAVEAWAVVQGQWANEPTLVGRHQSYADPGSVRLVREELHERMKALNSGQTITNT